jgi:manganese/zinc/iron transport system substrate-binding protein
LGNLKEVFDLSKSLKLTKVTLPPMPPQVWQLQTSQVPLGSNHRPQWNGGRKTLKLVSTRIHFAGLSWQHLLLATCFLLPLFGCKPSSSSPTDSSTKPVLVATTGMIADIVSRLTEEDAEVIQLMGDGVDPHLYKPTRDDMIRLTNADIVFYNGLMLEGKMQELLARDSSSQKFIAVTKDIPQQNLLGGEIHADPHVWMDVRLWKIALSTMTEELCRKLPQHTDKIRDRFKKLEIEFDALHSYGLKAIESIPKDQRILITSHDAFQYFGEAYGLEVQAIQGISTESEAGLQRINEIVDLIVTRKIPAVFVESSVPRDTIEAVVQGAEARGHKIKIGAELFSDALGATGTYEGTYPGMLDHNFTSVTRGLGGNAPPQGMNQKLSKLE